MGIGAPFMPLRGTRQVRNLTWPFCRFTLTYGVWGNAGRCSFVVVGFSSSDFLSYVSG